MTQRNFSALKYFLGTYFHQDCYVDGGTDNSIVREFVEHETTENVYCVLEDINQLTNGNYPRTKIKKILDEFDLSTEGTGMNSTEWLESIGKKLSGVLSQTFSPVKKW